MILSDNDIKKYLDEKTIVVDPITDSQIQPASVDLRLGSHFLKIDENSSASTSCITTTPLK